MKRQFLCYLLFFFGLFSHSQAQDPHFTQYFASPLTLNPALTGFFDGDSRIAVNQRQQWFNVGTGYYTTSVSADFKIMADKISEYDTFGIGVSGLYDSSLNGGLQSNYLSISSAYHKNLADHGSQTLAVGFQVTLADRFIDYYKLSFASQYKLDYFDTSIPPDGISYAGANTKYAEVNTGVLYAVHDDKYNLYLGASLYHINKPKETLFDPAGYVVPFRETIHSGGEILLNDQSSLLFSGFYMQQGGITDKLIGTAYAIKLPTLLFDEYSAPTKFYIGLWYRPNDSFIPYLGMEYKHFDVGLNYTIPTSSIFTYSPNTFELSVIYRYKSKTSLCPHF